MTYKYDNFFSKNIRTILCGLVVISCVIPNIANGATVKRSARAAIPKQEPEEIIIENKTSQFDDFMSEMDLTTSGDDNALAESIRAQRAAFTAQSNQSAAKMASERAMAGNQNDCDQKLRACMQNKCGNDFTKCSGDTDTILGTKLDSCRRDTTCTGEEYRLFTTEIKADMASNAELSFYNSVIDCGNRYNNCIITQCGTTFSKCLGKKSGDKAVEKCKTIAKECTEQDSGLASRAMSVFGSLRTDAEVRVANNEKRLLELRNLMRETCSRLGAMFDDRTLDCVYSVEFYAGEDNTLQASKKAYAGSTFACTPNWFGVDVTTFMENAQRATRAQTAASSAMMGSGLGIGVGAVTSGAIDRAVDRKKADDELHKALCEKTKGTWRKALKSCNCPKGQKFDKEEGCISRNKKGKNADAPDEVPDEDSVTPGSDDQSDSSVTPGSDDQSDSSVTPGSDDQGGSSASDSTSITGYDHSKSAMDNAAAKVLGERKINSSNFTPSTNSAMTGKFKPMNLSLKD